MMKVISDHLPVFNITYSTVNTIRYDVDLCTPYRITESLFMVAVIVRLLQ